MILLLPAACSRSLPPDPVRTDTTALPTASAMPTPSSTPPVPPELRVLSAGFGGVGPASPPGAPNAWVVALVEVASPGAALSGVRAAAVTLVDPSGAVIARGTGPIDVRTAPPGRYANDFSEYGTAPFGGGVAKGATVVLRLHAALDTRLETLAKALPGTRARIELADEKGLRASIEGSASMWPTG